MEQYHVAFVNPKSSTKVFMGQIPSLATPVLAGELLRLGYSVSQHYEPIREVSAEDFAHADVICFTAFTNNAKRAYSIARDIKQVFPEKITIMGGWHANFLFNEALKSGIDYVVRGEGEQAIIDLLQMIRAGDIKPGVVYEKPTASLDETAFPDFFSIVGINSQPFSYHPLQISRGCNHRCSFCQIVQLYSQIKIKSPERVAREVERVHENYARGFFKLDGNYEHIFLFDDNFGAKPVRNETKEILRYLGSTGLMDNLRISTQARIDIAEDMELLQLFRQSGGTQLLLGIESVNDIQLREMRKGTSGRQISESIKKIRSLGFETMGLFCVGNDSDTVQDVERIPEIVHSLALDNFLVQILTPLPATAVYEKFSKERRIIDTDWDHYDFEHIVIRPARMTPEELHTAHDNVRRQNPLSSIYAGSAVKP